MKKVETVSINGVVFSITDDACRNLSDYLDVLHKYFEHEKDGNEIIADIEARIAELFTGRAGGISQVITDKDVLHVIETLGAPEDIIDSDGSGDNPPPPPPPPPRNTRTKQTAKRLYRNPDQSVLGGVCSGIALWLDISVIIVRLVFVACLLLYGITILVYFLLWIIIPMAKTTAQKLEMQGQPINISNIEKSIKSNMSSDRYTDETNRTPRIIWNIIRVCLGILLCFIGVSLALSFCSLVLMHDFIFKWRIFPFNRIFPFFISSSSYNIITISTILFMILTVAACIYWGVKIMTGTKVKWPYIHVILLIIWLITIPVATTTFIRDVGNFIGYNKSVKYVNINPCDTIYLNMKPSEFEIPDNLLNAYYDDENRCYYGKPNMYIRKSSGKNTLKITKTSRGRNNHLGFMYVNDISYDIDVKNSQITISPYFTIDNFIDWKNQRLEITLYIPENTVIIVDDSLCDTGIIDGTRQSGHDGNTCKWIMTHKGIKALD